MTIEKPRGTRDFIPSEMRKRRYVEGLFRDIAELHGFGEVMTPTFERTQLFVSKSGGEILSQTYNFRDKKGREMLLRPEMTAPVARLVGTDMKDEMRPLKLYYFSNCFRYERPQRGRYREFWQFGLEVIKPFDVTTSLVELVGMAVEMLRAAHISDFVIRVGNNGSGDVEEFVKRIGCGKVRPEKIKIDDTLKRGLDYYTGLVFEIDVPTLGAEKQICGGGEYSLKSVNGIDETSVGFAIGFDRVMLAQESIIIASYIGRKKVLVFGTEGVMIEDVEATAWAFRNWHNMIVDYSPLTDRAKNMKYADKHDFDYVVILDGETWDMGKVIVRDMTTGDEEIGKPTERLI